MSYDGYPESLLAAEDAGGAFQIGSNWGQDYTESSIRALWQVPSPTPINALNIFRQSLMKLPLEALKGFEGILTDVAEGTFNAVGTAVDAIMNALLGTVTFLTHNAFTEWVGSAFHGLAVEARQVWDILAGLIVTPINAAVSAVKAWWISLTGKTQHLDETGGYDAGNLVGEIGKDVVEGLTDLGLNVVGFFKGIYDTWFGGSSGSGTLAEATYTIEAIKDAVLNGYTVHTVTSNEAAWAVPSPTPMDSTAILIGGGEHGNNGSSGGGSGGDGGLHGSYIAMPIDLTGITALDIQIGTAGNLSYVREANTTTPHSGAILAQSAIHGSPGGIASMLGLTVTASLPGSGGKGSNYNTSNGTGGESSSLAVGGNRGSSGPAGRPGGAGGSVSAGSKTKCGGAGGGGGGAATVALGGGGNGGPGGYPGGGGGGGGAYSGLPGSSNGGAGAPGIVFLIYK